MERYKEDNKKSHVECPAGIDDQVITTVVAFHPNLVKALSKEDNGKAVGNLPFIVEDGKIQEDGSVVSVSLSHDPKVLSEILRMRKDREAKTGVSR